MKNFFRVSLLAFTAAFIISGCTAVSKEAEVVTTVAETTTTAAPVTTTPEPEEKPAEYIAFFAEQKVHDIKITIPEKDWDAIKLTPEEESYYSADIKIDNEELTNIGIRTKGNSSLNQGTWQGLGRFPFHLKFDKYVDDQRFLGLDDMVLNNSTDDASYVREYYGYEAFRQLGMEVPLVTYCNVYINDELIGLYLGVEVINSSYLDRVYGNHKASLYKAREGATLETAMDIALLDGKKGAPEDKADIKELIKVINETKTGEKGELEKVLDVDSVLKYFAASAVIHSWDDYSGWFSQNYYFYKNNGRFEIIPWDVNETFTQTQAFYNESDGARQDIATPITGWDPIQRRPMTEKLLAVPEYYERYLEYCNTLLTWLEGISSTTELSRMRTLIGQYVAEDPTAFFGDYAFALEFDPTYSDGIAGFISERVEYLKERLPQLMKEDEDDETTENTD